MARLKLDRELCKGCLLCTVICPKGLLKNDGRSNSRGFYTVGIERVQECTGCALCAEVCPDVSIEVWK